MRGLGTTAGFDLNTKNDSYASKKRMLVIGPTPIRDVPGLLNLSALFLDESNSPAGITNRFHYKDHGAPEADFGIGIGSLPLAFKGYALYIGSKGLNEFGGGTKPETHIDVALTWDVGSTDVHGKERVLDRHRVRVLEEQVRQPGDDTGRGSGCVVPHADDSRRIPLLIQGSGAMALRGGSGRLNTELASMGGSLRD